MSIQSTTRTEGFWNVERPYGEPGVYIAGPDTSLVAKVWDNENTMGNAKLIAAAPELLDALEVVFQEFLHYRPQGVEYATLGGKRADIVEAQVRALLSKLQA